MKEDELFSYNLVKYRGEMGRGPSVYRNDAVTVEGVLALQPIAIVISPGPSTPQEAGISVALARAAAAAHVPLLGVFLPPQAVGPPFAAKAVLPERRMHRKTCAAPPASPSLLARLPHPLPPTPSPSP